jgi:hypothetical protein
MMVDYSGGHFDPQEEMTEEMKIIFKLILRLNFIPLLQFGLWTNPTCH